MAREQEVEQALSAPRAWGADLGLEDQPTPAPRGQVPEAWRDLYQGWLRWRGEQAAETERASIAAPRGEPVEMIPPIAAAAKPPRWSAGQPLAGYTGARFTELPAVGKGAMVRRMREMERVPIPEAAKSPAFHEQTELGRLLESTYDPARGVTFGARQTPGQTAWEELLTRPAKFGTPIDLMEDILQRPARYQAAAHYLPVKEAVKANLRNKMNELARRDPEVLKDIYLTGRIRDDWYAGAIPTIERHLAELQRLSPGALIDPSRDPVTISKLIASTSPQTEPNLNVYRALVAYSQYLKSGRNPRFDFKAFAPFESYYSNILRAVRDDPLSGLKVSNYLLNQLGSEHNVTIDRWMVNILLDRKSDAANVLDYEYQAAANRIVDLARLWNTTPVRAQAAMWTGQKMLQDGKMVNFIWPKAMGGKHGLAPEQAIPALRDVIHQQMTRLETLVARDPRVIEMGKQEFRRLTEGRDYNPNWAETIRKHGLVYGLAGVLIEEANREDAADRAARGGGS